MALNLFIYFHCVKSLSWSVKTLDTLNMLKLIKKFLLFDLVMAKESLIVMKSHVQKVATNIWIWKKEDVLKMNAFVKMIMMLSSPQWYFFKNFFQNYYMILIISLWLFFLDLACWFFQIKSFEVNCRNFSKIWPFYNLCDHSSSYNLVLNVHLFERFINWKLRFLMYCVKFSIQ